MYTSGTESRPKGVLLSSRSLVAQYVSCAIDGGMSGDDIELHTLPMYHCAQLDCFFCVDIYLGATSIILPGPDPARMLLTIEQEQVTKLFCPPTVWISLLRHPDFERRDLTACARATTAPQPCRSRSSRAARTAAARDLWNFYGQTEMAPLATILRPQEQATHAGSAGPGFPQRGDAGGRRRRRRGAPGRPSARSFTAALRQHWATTATRPRPPRRSASGWFHSGILACMTPMATSRWWTGRRT